MITAVKLSNSSLGLKRCVSVHGDESDLIRLKRLGIFSGAEIELVHAGDPMILKVVGTRVGLSRMLASSIEVENIETDSSQADAAT